jgi:hypothetical protein
MLGTCMLQNYSKCLSTETMEALPIATMAT